MITRFLAFSFLCFFAFSNAQIYNQDSLSGGNYSINADEKLNELLLTYNNMICPPVEEYKPCADPEEVRVNGYKIQIIYSKNKTEALKAQQDFDALFPRINSQLEYNAPDFKIQVGNYLTKEDLQRDLRNIKRKFPESFPVFKTIRCDQLTQL